MAKLSPNTETVLDGDVRLTRRGGSSAWQAAFKIGDRWVRVTTKCRQLAEAKAAAKELYMEYRFKAKHDLPIVTKRFDAVAALVVADLRRQLTAGVGKKVFKDYITATETYLIPFFGTKHVNNISFTELKEFAVWRASKMGREPKASTITTHNTTLNRVFEEAVNRGYMSKSKIPTLVNTGDDGERRPDFDLDAYRSLVRKLPHWARDDTVHTQKSRDMRMLLWDYVIVLANSGIRHGTEAENLRWRNVHVWEETGRVYMEFQGVKGKTKAHNVMCRPSAITALRRVHARTYSIAGIEFMAMLKQRLDLPVFALPDGTVSKHLNQTFKPACPTRLHLVQGATIPAHVDQGANTSSAVADTEAGMLDGVTGAVSRPFQGGDSSNVEVALRCFAQRYTQVKHSTFNSLILRVILVAGTGFEPVTFRL